MKSVLFVTLALAFSSPALAADQPSKTSQHMQAMADKLNDPKAQAAMVGGLDAMIAALMDIRVDGIAKALEPLNGGKKIKMKGDTLRDIAAKDDRDFDKKLHTGTKTMVAGVGAMSSALAAMMPALEEATEKMDAEMAKVADKLPETR